MTDWKMPDIGIVQASADCFGNDRCMGSDTLPVNIFLLSGKYDIKTAFAGKALLRYYNGSRPNRRGYGFPLMRGSDGLSEIIGIIRNDAYERGIELRFCLCDERQKAALDKVCYVDWSSTDDDSDYIYKREALAGLAGKKLHRKRNHINSFMRLYDSAEYRALSAENAGDALAVAEKWLRERESPGEDELTEFSCIQTALGNIERLGIFGGVLYVRGEPVAMTAASSVSGCMTDVHFEKSFGEFAENGAFAVINRGFAASAGGEYINREEDMGIEGLRTAKESYFPAFKLKKYYGVCRC